MAAPHMAPPHMETAPQTSETHRITRSGRKIWYRLTVLQEPERARACGSGPKSTTDRRPVDPPPVIELRIFEGDKIETGKDITFTYNANFFLFTTLEHARPVANGRVNTPAATTPPVLTGMFVSGMAYLDRPTEAGYFLFPDLSVRHEGRYKLIFNLYEQTKEDKDKDVESSHQPHRVTQSQGDFSDLDESFDHRLKVESRAFSVYSAKKFPGLTESTVLSRTISEQGCRVRIRRDVRMRRRENKPSAGNDYEAKQKEEYERRQRTQTPEIKPNPFRGRSLSNSSMERPLYPDPYGRRPSVAEYHPPAPPPPPPQAYANAPHTPTTGGHLQFGQPAGSQYPQPPQQFPPPHQQSQVSPVTPKQQHYPPQRSYPTQYPQLPAPPSQSPRPPRSHSTERPPSQPHQYPLPPRDSNDNSRRPSASYPAESLAVARYSAESNPCNNSSALRSAESLPGPSHTVQASAESHGSGNFPSQASTESRRSPNYPAPVEPQPSPSHSAAPSVAESTSGSFPTTPSAESHSAGDRFAIALPGVNCDAPQSIRLPPIDTFGDYDRPNRSSFGLSRPASFSNLQGFSLKRRFDQSFNNEGQHQSLSNGARQADPHLFPPVNRMPGYDEPAGPSLHYRRADGHVDAKDSAPSTPYSSASRESFHHAPYNL